MGHPTRSKNQSIEWCYDHTPHRNIHEGSNTGSRFAMSVWFGLQVKLMSEFVRPDLELSSDSIDFGHVVVGQVKRITIKSLG